MALKIHASLFKASHFNLLSRIFRIPNRRSLSSNKYSIKTIPYSAIPKTNQIPILGSLPYFIKAGGQTYLHKYADDYHKKLGPIFIDNISGNELLFVSDPEANAKVYAAEGPTPEHFLLDIWKLYLEETGQKRGIFFMDGEEWKKTRTVLNKIILRPKSMVNHVQSISEVCQDLMKIWGKNPNVDLEYQMYCWNIECIGDISLGKRLGFVERLGQGTTTTKDDEFVKAVHQIFEESANLYIWPAKMVKKLGFKSWKRFYSAVKTALEHGNHYVEEAYKDCLAKDVDTRTENSMLYKVIQEQSLDKETIKSVFVDLFLASADTTSHTACWAIYLLGRNPDVAERTRKEIFSVLEKESTLTLETIAKIPYISGIIRETLRLYPTAAFLTRKVATDTTMCGFSVPAGTMVISSLYSMGRNSKYFTDPEEFRPERWFTKKSETTENTVYQTERLVRKAYVPWGLGKRSCVGKRTAEIELSLLIMEALKTFEWTVDEEVNMILRMITVPSKDIKLNLKPRST